MADADPIHHPAHYVGGRKYEPIDVIEDWGLDFARGNTVKYISRAGRKDPERTVDDLRKAAWYLARAIANAEKVEGASDRDPAFDAGVDSAREECAARGCLGCQARLDDPDYAPLLQCSACGCRFAGEAPGIASHPQPTTPSCIEASWVPVEERVAP